LVNKKAILLFTWLFVIAIISFIFNNVSGSADKIIITIACTFACRNFLNYFFDDGDVGMSGLSYTDEESDEMRAFLVVGSVVVMFLAPVMLITGYGLPIWSK
jgi:hypothetical protein